ncbi:TIGR01459 family HAD-type hydrolase [Defluviimonas sp. WL0075]|uniref:TIGR01459 family HAD-type hydrolase n=1 Tax=Albidovulum sediminicola TaxID=2984331 RepID=A0ABT2Z226_9RHOB|nr:TIGR01459 family HAD-type hydrolase [Defluviimonas sp. WL0075]MCV2865090.1 TIGR01459 family HAD-type hydrolase [Defluviimonas sp. WL0075]
MKPATLKELAARFDAFLVDQFGVLLTGSGAYDFAPAALSRLSSYGKPVILLSNSGKRSAPNEARLTRLGFARGSYLTVMSSGEAAYSALRHRIGADLAPGTAVWVHARDGDQSNVAGLGLVPVDSPADAGLIVLAGSLGDVLTLDDYRALLAPAARRAVPCLCTNPDMEMLTPQGIRFGAGRIARLYEELGGPVEWIGKPHPLIYAEAARLLPGIAPDRILCIGDSPAHDVAGGQAAGYATALVRTGLHAELDDTSRAALCENEGAVPDFVIPCFCFDPPEA